MDINCDWLLHTANCGEDIQSSGTFRKAVNLRINNTITPLLSELIACLDRNGNLELALCNEEVPECLFNLWQDIFRDDRLFVLQYKDTVSPHTLLPRRRVPVLSDGAGGKYFKAHFPFSWLINQCASQVFSEIKNLSGLTNQVKIPHIWLIQCNFDYTTTLETSQNVRITYSNNRGRMIMRRYRLGPGTPPDGDKILNFLWHNFECTWFNVILK